MPALKSRLHRARLYVRQRLTETRPRRPPPTRRAAEVRMDRAMSHDEIIVSQARSSSTSLDYEDGSMPEAVRLDLDRHLSPLSAVRGLPRRPIGRTGRTLRMLKPSRDPAESGAGGHRVRPQPVSGQGMTPALAGRGARGGIGLGSVVRASSLAAGSASTAPGLSRREGILSGSDLVAGLVFGAVPSRDARPAAHDRRLPVRIESLVRRPKMSSGPVRRKSPNLVRSGRKQRSGGATVRRRST